MALEAEIKSEEDLKEQAEDMIPDGPDAFKSAVQHKHDKFKMAKQIEALTTASAGHSRPLHKLVQEFDQTSFNLNEGRKTRGELIVDNRKMYDTIQSLLKAQPHSHKWRNFLGQLPMC